MAPLVAAAGRDLAAVNVAREAGLPLCRQAIRAASSAIRAIHRLDDDRAAALIADCEAAIRGAQEVLSPYPAVAFAGFLHDAEKEYAEAVLTRALVAGTDLPAPEAVGVGVPAWLNGLAEAASELRRHLLDRLRRDQTAEAERLLEQMEDVYEALVGVDLPDAVTGGLRRSADALRAVLERTRSDVTTTVMQLRLRTALERSAAGLGSGAGGPDRI
jgi:translin